MSKQKNTANLELICTKIKALEKKTIANVIEIGGLLEQASEQCEHGEFENWLEANFGWSFTTVRRYRAVFGFSKSTNLADLNISVSALYLAIDLPWMDDRHKAIIAAAKKGRVSYSRAKQIADEVECGLKIKLLPDEVTSPKADEAPPPSSDDDVKDGDEEKHSEYQDWLAQEDIREPVKLLQRLDELLRHQHRDWAKAIKDVGPIRVREIIHLLTAALDTYSVKNAVKAKADAAEAKSKALPVEREPA
jgi:Protein of unknown function (DUF3102)